MLVALLLAVLGLGPLESPPTIVANPGPLTWAALLGSQPTEGLLPGGVLGAEVQRPWSGGELVFPGPVEDLWGLARSAAPGLLTYDAGSGQFFASSAGALVQVARDGSLVVVDPDLDARDLDVRRAPGLVAYRGNDGIYLRSLGAPGSDRLVATGDFLFGPRFDPAGRRLLLNESGPRGPRFLVLEAASGGILATIKGAGPVWLDGDRVLFFRSQDDGHRITGAELWLLDLGKANREQQLTHSPGVAETWSAPSPDGRWLLYLDAVSGRPGLLRLPGKEASHVR